MIEKGLFRAFALVAAVTAGGVAGCASNNNNNYQYNQVRGQTGQVIQNVGGEVGRRVGEKATEVLGHSVTEENCRVLRVEHQTRMAEMQADPKMTQEAIAGARIMHEKLQSDCDKQAAATRRTGTFLGNIADQLGRIGGQILNNKSGMRY